MLLHNILGFQVMLCFYYRVFIQFFPMESMFVEQNFRCLYKPIGELFRFFSKWDDIYSVQCIISEIFSRIGDNLFSSSSSSSSSWTRSNFKGRRSQGGFTLNSLNFGICGDSKNKFFLSLRGKIEFFLGFSVALQSHIIFFGQR